MRSRWPLDPTTIDFPVLAIVGEHDGSDQQPRRASSGKHAARGGA